MSRIRDFAILSGSLVVIGTILTAVEKFEGFERMVWLGLFVLFCMILGLALQIEKLGELYLRT
jgi:hypothetical protein